MKNLEGYLNFWPEFEADIEITEKDLCVLYRKNEILVKKDSKVKLPSYGECEELIKEVSCLWHLGKWQGRECFAYELPSDEEYKVIAKDEVKEKLEVEKVQQVQLKQKQSQESMLHENVVLEERKMEWVGFRDLRWNEQLELYQIVVKAQHILNWDRTTRYCGCCGSLYERKKDERAKKCPNCGNLQFPRISPAIIVGIKKDNQILMAHNSGFREGLYSVIAGFVEQGETLETAVKREIYEEVGIKVKNIQYFQSRPWNSMDSLMIGFIAEYESGEIKVDGKEIVDARWCDKEHMPEVLPDKISTAWHIINEIIGLEE